MTLNRPIWDEGCRTEFILNIFENILSTSYIEVGKYLNYVKFFWLNMVCLSDT